jgi:hypothetical protein
MVKKLVVLGMLGRVRCCRKSERSTAGAWEAVSLKVAKAMNAPAWVDSFLTGLIMLVKAPQEKKRFLGKLGKVPELVDEEGLSWGKLRLYRIWFVEMDVRCYRPGSLEA